MRIPPRFLAATAVAATLLVGGPTAVAAEAAPAPARTVSSSSSASASSTLSVAAVGSICYSALPSEAYTTLNLIARGGPYPYPQDGGVFQNREGVLPQQSTGYYHEYTVKTPGSSTRGARRIVTGKAVDEDYYTADHYVTFKLVKYSC
ncbi:ribonuclease domain-containing protein [Streptomyces sp. NPDC091292]|uniref:ribonuclease domain-containing protein n=1 Tax=Streptomyces sp. NPDC091292 TaxID=3365991 RepID=UPI003828152C